MGGWPRLLVIFLCFTAVLGPAGDAPAAETLVIFREFGGPGQSPEPPGTLDQPVDVTADAAGNVYVADTGNHRIQKFAPDGQLLWVRGKVEPATGVPMRGDGPNEFSTPKDVALTPDGDLVVADSDNVRVQRLETDGTFKSMFPTGGRFGPQSISVASDGSIYVSDTFNHAIYRFAGDGSGKTTFGEQGALSGQFNSPFDVSVAGDALYVADTENHRIQQLRLDGVFVRQWGEEGDKPGQFLRPASVGATTGGRVFVADRDLSRIDEFTPDGRHVLRFGFGEELAQPGGVFAIGDDVYVADTDNSRVVRLLRAQTPPPGTFCASQTGACSIGPDGVPAVSMPSGDRSALRFVNPRDVCETLGRGANLGKEAFYNGQSFAVRKIAGGFEVEIPAEQVANATLIVSSRCPKAAARAAQGGFDYDVVNETWGDSTLIDPSGFIRDARTKRGLEGAVVTLYSRPSGAPSFGFADPLGVSPRVNPQRSDRRGHYGWDVPEGSYRIKVERFGYRTKRRSRIVFVPPPVTDLHIMLTPIRSQQARLIGARGIGRLRLGTERADARRVARRLRPRPELRFRRGKLAAIEVSSPRYRTGPGIGAGSTEAELLTAYGGRAKARGSAARRRYRLGRISFHVRNSNRATAKVRRVTVG